MKKKQFSIVLIILVGIIWYNVFLRVKSNFVAEDSLLQIVKTNTIRPLKKRETFVLDLDFIDPFLKTGNSSLQDDLDVVDEASSEPDEYIPPPPLKWPNIKFIGIIKKQGSTHPLVLLNVDKKLFKIKPLEHIYGELSLSKVFRDSIEMKFGDEKQFYMKMK
jgi:hypothetical protein